MVMDVRPSLEAEMYQASLDEQMPVFLDEQRATLVACLDGLTDEQARRRLVPSSTTLLGLVKHATFVEQVWFDEAVTARTRAEIGIPATVDESFELADGDTIDSVVARYREVCEQSRRTLRGRSLDDVVSGNRRGPMTLRWVCLHALRETAQHGGHADILRELVLAEG